MYLNKLPPLLFAWIWWLKHAVYYVNQYVGHSGTSVKLFELSCSTQRYHIAHVTISAKHDWVMTIITGRRLFRVNNSSFPVVCYAFYWKVYSDLLCSMTPHCQSHECDSRGLEFLFCNVVAMTNDESLVLNAVKPARGKSIVHWVLVSLNEIPRDKIIKDRLMQRIMLWNTLVVGSIKSMLRRSDHVLYSPLCFTQIHRSAQLSAYLDATSKYLTLFGVVVNEWTCVQMYILVTSFPNGISSLMRERLASAIKIIIRHPYQTSFLHVIIITPQQ